MYLTMLFDPSSSGLELFLCRVIYSAPVLAMSREIETKYRRRQSPAQVIAYSARIKSING